MFEKYTLRWYDPFFGWGDHSKYYNSSFSKTLKNFDTGLCNRLLHWEVACEINQNYENIFTILLQDKIWPEIHLLDLPKSQPSFYNKYDFHYLHGFHFESLHFKTVYDFQNQNVRLATKIDTEKLNKLVFEKDKLENETHFYSDFGFTPLKKLYNQNGKEIDSKKRHLKKIKLKHRFVEDVIKKFCKDCVGLHIRRNNGVKITNDDFNKMDYSIKEKYISLEKQKNADGNYKFFGDDLYFNIIDKILEFNPKQTFYISHDLPDNFLNYYKEKYGNHLIKTRDEIIYEILSYYYSSGIDVLFLENYGRVITNIIDLFSLSNCKFSILSPQSTWSEFAEIYNDNPSIYITEPSSLILSEYIENQKKKLLVGNKKLF